MIRGIAILGILLMNIRSFAMADGAYFYPSLYDHFESLPDRLTWFAGELFWSHKFYTLLALLFGAGIVLMADSARARGVRPAPQHYRRAAGLAGIGLLHAYLLWHGDILFQYAVCAALAYPLHRLRARTLLVLSIILQLAALAIYLPGVMDDTVFPYDRGDFRQTEEAELAIRRGSWTGQFALRAILALQMQTAGLMGACHTLGMMLLGMVFLKTGVLGGHCSPGRLRSLALPCCVAGWVLTAGGLCYWWITGFGLIKEWSLAGIFTLAGGTVTSLGYLAAIRLWVHRGGFPLSRSILEAVGRTALSNYLLQSLLAAFIFHGQGLGLVGSIGRPGQLLFVLLIWSLQIPLTLIWLKKHPRGPAEMLLRWISRGRADPL